ncbi:RNA methyltransferase [marine bacterium AO1-C]|nr:RNA methyltransferase [marine bacterium AO1-C]
MAYNELLGDRIRQILQQKQVAFEEKKMFGGLCFMVDQKMCVGIVKEDLMARIGPDAFEEALKKKGVRDMDFAGRPMKGYVFVEPEAMDMDTQLEYWVQLCLDFNPLAKASKKKKSTQKKTSTAKNK